MLAVLGEKHCACLGSDALLRTFGDNEEAQLGRDSDNQFIPKKIRVNKTFRVISCGLAFTAAIDSFGNVYTFGSNEKGELGKADKRAKNNIIEYQKAFSSPACSIQSGYHHTLCLTEDGSLWAWGSNEDGQLGLFTTQIQTCPQEVKISSPVSFIACGSYHSFVSLYSGEVWGSGNNIAGQLGLGDTKNRQEFTQLELSNTSYGPLEFSSISCGSKHSIFLTPEGDVYATGLNARGQLGVTTPQIPLRSLTHVSGLQNIREIACGYTHTAFVNQENALFLSGLGFAGCGRPPKRHPILKDVLTVSRGGFGLIVKTETGIWCTGVENTDALGSLEDPENRTVRFHEKYNHVIGSGRRSMPKSARK